MPTEFLLDTATLIELARKPFGPASEKMRSVQENKIFTSVIVASLLEFRILKTGATGLQKQIHKLLSNIEIRPLPVSAAQDYGLIKFRLGKGLADDDLWIAAHAIAENAVLVTNNIRQFSRITNLKVENWMQSA